MERHNLRKLAISSGLRWKPVWSTDPGSAPEAPLPEPMTWNGHMLSPRLIFVRLEGAAQGRFHARRFEKALLDNLPWSKTRIKLDPTTLPRNSAAIRREP
jgi:hypothetical protein